MTAVMARPSSRVDAPAMRTVPYRVLFPAGLAFALAGALVWPAQSLGLLPWAGPLHRTLMMEGFELSFVAGFLLTAMSGLLHAERCRPGELAAVFTMVLAFALACAAGVVWMAHAAFTLALATVAVTLVRRARAARIAPPVEMAFVALGLAHGLAGGVLGALVAAGRVQDPSPGFATRLVSLGMMLPVVLGVGTLIVPVFAGVRDPLLLPGIAAPHARGRRRTWYALLALALVGATVADGMNARGAAAWLRLGAAAPALIGGWKLHRGPRPGALPVALRLAGSGVLAGLLLAAALPDHPLAGEHLVYIGGYGLLTLAVATRVVLAHGGHGITGENRIVAPWPAALIAVALAGRLAGEWMPAALAWAALAWVLAWVVWGASAVPRIIRTAAPATAPRVVASRPGSS